ncbi:P-loop containing nucleoside triphosphate hydrolase protein [Daldinia caldariorum]|uniref:P-loop containing nucleoside triphosphate hydrolase protein n=1 Tax=Daldinia caldariorum TaxID=326644 RepID=UPI0020074DA8|nr:P-loop containing nucleoside triphosphate hydrolase protein [Daldinia caldariorum]KAI1470781.1 P-loop containing nucleoside triphosphate hydrolase protein [Daldinia caldariorum]
MGNMVESTPFEEKPSLGNLSILTKVDKLRELIGTKVALPQLVVVGDQSSGKSSVLEGLTNFGFPRDAELCTRYATQITCRREKEEIINVSIIPHDEASAGEQARIKKFYRSLKAMTPESLAEVFTEANEVMGIKSSTKATLPDGTTLPAFSEHILKIEKLGPDENHFTVIDVPGIFRKETEGITTEADIELVRNMVKKYMKDPRTIILAIMPSNVDPATQEILKLAKEADPLMTRTMAVLTKPDLAIERVMQQIAIDHVNGKRGDLVLGYYIVKNRGPDDAHKTLKQGQADEKKFFSESPWSSLRNTERAGMEALKKRVRDLLTELIKKEFPKLKTDVARELSTLKSDLNKMGPSRDHQDAQRAYLNKICQSFQALVRDALNAYYAGNKIFAERHDLRLITRIVEMNEIYSDTMLAHGHTRPFSSDSIPKEETVSRISTPVGSADRARRAPKPDDGTYPELEEILDDSLEVIEDVSDEDDIMDYIARVYRDSRGQDLGTFSNALVSTMFKEQSKNWKNITLDYVKRVIWIVHHFIFEAIKESCPDERVRDELWNGFLLEELQKAYREAISRVMFLLEVEHDGQPLTLNHYFNDALQRAQSGRLVDAIKELGSETSIRAPEGSTNKYENGIFLTHAQLHNLSFNMANSEHVQEYMHDILKSYYKVSRKRFVDVVCQQVVNYDLLHGKCNPLKIFNTEMVLELTDEQLDAIAAEDIPVKRRREKLERDISSFQEAWKVLKGSG